MFSIKHLSAGRRLLIALCAVLFTATLASAQTATGIVRGRITFAANGESVHNATVILSPSGRSTETDDDGNYEFTNVVPGDYQVIARLPRISDAITRVTVTETDAAIADLTLSLSGVREEVTVTASSADESTLNAIRPTTVVDSLELTERAHTSIGEVLEYQPGVAKRSFGPGSSRPVIRGFDGDRILVLQDNLPISSLGSQSGDHGEPINVLSLDKVELVRGPGTLLYGSNAIGGVVNTITSRDAAPEAPRGYLTTFGGSASKQAGGSAGFELGLGRNFMVYANGGGQRTGDYETPTGRIPNSKTRSFDGTAGVGYFADRSFFRVSGTYDQRLYGVPFAGLFEGGGEAGDEVAQIDLRMRRQNVRFNGGLRNLDSFISGFTVFADYTDYQHLELEGAEVGTVFNNDQFNYRTVFEQARRGKLSGRFGFQGFNRDYLTIGAETLAPPTKQNNFAVFGLEEVNFERVTFQFGGRVETNRYRPDGLPNRNFTGFSGSAGARIGLFENAALVANYTHSYRAPALEELYNFGPHIGNLTFEIGNSNLRRELTNGADVALRYGSPRARVELSSFYYNINDFVFLAPTGEIEDGLTEAIYSQADSRYYGGEIGFNFGIIRNRLNLDTSLDYVNARLKDGSFLPRIPPARARIGLEFLSGGFRVEPEAIFASDQEKLFPGETRTAGYGIFNLRGSYTFAEAHFAHVFSVDGFNLTDKLYRNHVSFIKELAPEIGRGVRASYTVRFF